MQLKLLLCIVPLVAAITFTPVPIFYITQGDVTSQAREVFTFNMALCGGEQFEHNDGNVFINFPERKWNPVIGDYVQVKVLDGHSHVIATNEVSGDFQPNFNFHYHSTLGDLRLVVTAGNVPDIKYTITVTFTVTPSNNPHYSSQPLTKKRYYSTEAELTAWEIIKETSPKGTTQDMLTVFKTTTSQTVGTAAVIGLELGYCFNPHTFPGQIFVSVLANDETSGFATYACTHEINCTHTDEANYFDISGASVNFVPVHLTNPVTQVGPIKLLVRGDGRVSGQNNFTLGASRYFSDPK